MIQRIQSVWLLLSGILFGLQSLKSTVFARTLNTLNAPLDDKILSHSENSIMLTGSLLSAGLAIIAIFLFKNRSSQIMLAGFAGLVQIALSLGFGFFVLNQVGGFGQFAPDFGIYLGLLGLTSNWLATRAIRKDSELVKSMDRLR